MHEDRLASGRNIAVETTLCGATSISGQVHLGFVPVRLVGKGMSVETCAFLDNGSDTTLIREDIVNRMGLDILPMQVKICTVRGVESVNCGQTKLKIHLLSGDAAGDVNKAYTIGHLQIETVGTERLVDGRQFSHLSHIDFPSPK